jgi:1-phosphatidylinositol phosphodiesterase
MTIEQQLNAGIRFFDIRCRHYENSFPIHHAEKFQNQFFVPDVMEVCVKFLNAHPLECIVMHIKKEYSEADCTETFQETFERNLQGFQRFWYLGDTVPMLGDVRGKIVLLRRFDAERLPLGIDATSWEDKATFTISNNAQLRIQDEYDVPTLCNIDDKWDEAEALFEEAKPGDPNVWYINWTSGAVGASPENIAKGTPGIRGMNDFLLLYLLANPAGRIGTIGMDFPEYPYDNALAGEIIAHNTR